MAKKPPPKKSGGILTNLQRLFIEDAVIRNFLNRDVPPADRFKRASKSLYEPLKKNALPVDLAMMELDNLANENYPPAQRALGTIFSEGLFGFLVDEIRAFKYYLSAAESGDAEAAVKLGWLHFTGVGTKQDCAQAYMWIRFGVENGDLSGAEFLGRLYELGAGVPKDLEKADYWYRLAAREGP